MSRPLSFFLLLFFLLLVGVVGGQRLSSRLELSALYSLRGSLGIKKDYWPRKVDPCARWVGVDCTSGRVVGLRLSSLRRTRLGKLSPFFSVDGLRNLTLLSSFNASGFLLRGPIPAWLVSSLPSSFRSLDLSGCDVNGTIPSSLGFLANLTTLVLSQNDLRGPIPSSLGSLRSLQRLDLSSNSLNGSVPEELENLRSLKELNLSKNLLNGELPDSIWAAPELRTLDVSRNNLTGTLPEEAANFNSSGGGVLNLSYNHYFGNVSSGVARALGRLSLGDISNNYFQGEAPFVGNASVSVQLNCFLDAPGQRSETDCAEFYRGKGLVFVGRSPRTEENGSSQNRWRLVYILIGVIGGVLLLAVLLCLLVVFLRKCAAGAATNRQQESGGTAAVPSARGTTPPPVTPPLGSLSVNLSAVGDSFTYDQLLQATENFSDANLIKHGHTGDLYLGKLGSGAVVVVKRVDAEKIGQEMYGMAELDFFSRIAHTRLVPLLGHCLEKEKEKLIVYKYMPNGDLSNALYRKPGLEEEGLQSLDWITRLKIATGVAEALCYLHHECSPPIVHRDIQASSILLDDKFEVRLGSLSDVCTQEGEGNHNVISRIFRISQSAGASTSGTSPATCAYDIYCLGKVLLELVTGKLGISGSDNAVTQEFIEQTMPSISTQDKELLTKIVDPSLIVDEDLMEEVWAMAIVAKSCLNPKASKRLQAKIILKALENPLRVVRDENAHGSARLRTTSSRGLWSAALFGSWRSSDKEMSSVPPREVTGPKSSETTGSQGSVGEQSFNRRKPSKEIFPEPSSCSHEIGS